MEIALLYLITGMLLLTWSSDRFILGAVTIAKYFRVSPLFIGLTLVSLATSAPEIMVSIIASVQGKINLAIANVVGSNIANVGFVLGLSALLRPITVQSKVLFKEFYLLFAFMSVVALMLIDIYFSRLEGVFLGVLLILLIFWFKEMAKRDRDLIKLELEKFEQSELSIKKAIFWFALGTTLLPISANFVVIGASEIARLLGINEVIIGLTVVAIGTSLPEAGASISAALKGEQEIALGNVLGSNILNLIVVLPFVALLAPGKFDAAIMYRDVPVMFGFAILMWFLACRKSGKKTISRVEGGLLLGLYLGYMIYIVMGEFGQ